MDLQSQLIKMMPVLVYWFLIVKTVQNVTELFVVVQQLSVLGNFFDVVVKVFWLEILALGGRLIAIARGF